jgi:DNA-binding HxlR family transcriptional regulator
VSWLRIETHVTTVGGVLGPDCSIEATIALVGDRWALLVLRDVFRGVHRFSDMCTDLGIARNILADRLDRLVAAGILTKVPYQERPLRHEYHLTAIGRELAVPVIGLMHWGDRHLAGPAGPPRLTRHRDCGGALRAALTCTACGRVAGAGEVEIIPGPGLRAQT